MVNQRVLHIFYKNKTHYAIKPNPHQVLSLLQKRDVSCLFGFYIVYIG